MSKFVKVDLFKLRTDFVAGFEVTPQLAPSRHKDTNRPFLTVTVKKRTFFGATELVGTCHDLEWWFIDLEVEKDAISTLQKWGVSFIPVDVGY